MLRQKRESDAQKRRRSTLSPSLSLSLSFSLHPFCEIWLRFQHATPPQIAESMIRTGAQRSAKQLTWGCMIGPLRESEHNCPFPPGGCIFSNSWKSSTHPKKLEQTNSYHSSKRTLFSILTDFCWLLRKTFKTTLKAQSISNCSQK